MKRFWDNVSITDNCWNWTGAKRTRGYGGFYVKINGVSKTTAAHRFSFALHNGGIPNGMDILHKCDNTSCVNPDHLFPGTAKDNARDKMHKGRNRQRLPALTKYRRDGLRADHANGVSYGKVEKKYGVCHGTAWNIVNRKYVDVEQKNWEPLPKPIYGI